MTDQAHMQYRVVNAEGDPSPSMPYDLLSEAEDAASRRHDRYPEDGPQKIQQRYISSWETR